MALTELLELTRTWFVERNLQTADPKKQFLKLYEEAGELASGLAKQNEAVIKDSIGDVCVVVVGLCLQLELDMETVFTVVKAEHTELAVEYPLSTLFEQASKAFNCHEMLAKEAVQYYLRNVVREVAYIAQCVEVDFEDCFAIAYNEIKDRKGKLIDGVWVKEDDLVIVVDYQEAIAEVCDAKLIDRLASQYDFDKNEAEFKIIQPYADGQMVSFKIADDEDGVRGAKVDVSDNVFILPAKGARLSIFGGSEERISGGLLCANNRALNLNLNTGQLSINKEDD